MQYARTFYTVSFFWCLDEEIRLFSEGLTSLSRPQTHEKSRYNYFGWPFNKCTNILLDQYKQIITNDIKVTWSSGFRSTLKTSVQKEK